MRALGLDQAPRNNGFAIGTPDMKAPIAGLFRMDAWRDDDGPRLAEYQDWLSGLIIKHAITHIFREQVYPIISARSFEIEQQKAKIIGVIELTGVRHGCKVSQVLISDWRTRFLGTTKPFPGLKGDKARQWFKHEAVAQCARRQWFVDNTDAAEACAILDYGLCTISREYAGRTDVIFRRAQMRDARAA